MRGCNAQTNGRQLVPVLPLRTPRGLELIKSSAKFYANGAGTAKPTVQLSYLVHSASNNPAAERTSPAGKLSARAIAMFCLLLLVLPGLALAAIVWCGTRIADTWGTGNSRRWGELIVSAIGEFSRYGAKRCGTDCFERPIGYHHSQGEDGAHQRWRLGSAGSAIAMDN